jgi:hypothetical protein
VAVKIGQVLPDISQVEHSINVAKKVILGDMVFKIEGPAF